MTSGQVRGVGSATSSENPLRHYIGSEPGQWYTETPVARYAPAADGQWVLLSRYTTATKTAFALGGVDIWSGSRVLHPSAPTRLSIGHFFGGIDLDIARVVFVANDITQTQHNRKAADLIEEYAL